MKTLVIYIIIVFFTLYCGSNTYAQFVQQLVSNAQKIQERKPREIMYFQFDKPSYIIGDIENSGTSLHIDNLSNPGSVLVYVHSTPDLLGKEY